MWYTFAMALLFAPVINHVMVRTAMPLSAQSTVRNSFSNQSLARPPDEYILGGSWKTKLDTDELVDRLIIAINTVPTTKKVTSSESAALVSTDQQRECLAYDSQLSERVPRIQELAKLLGTMLLKYQANIAQLPCRIRKVFRECDGNMENETPIRGSEALSDPSYSPSSAQRNCFVKLHETLGSLFGKSSKITDIYYDLIGAILDQLEYVQSHPVPDTCSTLELHTWVTPHWHFVTKDFATSIEPIKSMLADLRPSFINCNTPSNAWTSISGYSDQISIAIQTWTQGKTLKSPFTVSCRWLMPSGALNIS